MQLLSQQQIMQVSGGDGFNMVFVSVDIPNSNLAAQVANIVGRLMNGQMDPASFAQAINDAGGNIVQYMYVAPSHSPCNMPGFPACP